MISPFLFAVKKPEPAKATRWRNAWLTSEPTIDISSGDWHKGGKVVLGSMQFPTAAAARDAAIQHMRQTCGLHAAYLGPIPIERAHDR